MLSKRYKLAILAFHPIQYQAPFFKRLAQNSNIDLMVYFCSDFGISEKIDFRFGQKLKWDIPLLDGYHYRFLKNYSPQPSTRKKWGLINLGIIKELFQNKYDAILVYGYSNFSCWLAFFGAWLTKTAIILGGETLLLPAEKNKPKFIKKFLFKRIQAFLPIGSKSIEFYKIYGVEENKLFLFPYSVDNDYFFKQREKWQDVKQNTKQELGIPLDLPVILYLGKFYFIKDLPVLLSAFEKVQDKAALVLVGDGEQKNMLKHLIETNNIKNVYFTGFINQSEVGKYYSLADVFILPSLQEKWGLVINEAMCFALPIVASDGVTAAVDLVRQGENGFVYPKGNAIRLARYLETLIDNPEKVRQMGRESLRIISLWNFDQCVKAILKALEHTVS